MEDDPRRERPAEDDPLDLFDSEGEFSGSEAAFEDRDFEPRAASPVYGTTPHGGSHGAVREPAPYALDPSLAQPRAGAPASPWMVITGAAAVVIVLLAVPLLLSGGSSDPGDLSSPSVEPDRSPASQVSRVPETRPQPPVESSPGSEDSSSADARNTDRASAAERDRAIEQVARDARTQAAREATTDTVNQRSREADTVATSRIPAVTPTPVRTETPTPPLPSPSSSTSPSTASSSSPLATSSAPGPPADTSPRVDASAAAATPPPASAQTPLASSTLPSGPAPAAVAERPVLSSEVARAAPPTATPITAVVPRDTQIQNAVYRYRDALNARDFSTLRTVYPSVNVSAMRAAFEKVPQTMSFEQCKILVKGPTASASCPGMLRYTRVGDSRERSDPHRWEFNLSEKNDAWVIDRVELR